MWRIKPCWSSALWENKMKNACKRRESLKYYFHFNLLKMFLCWDRVQRLFFTASNVLGKSTWYSTVGSGTNHLLDQDSIHTVLFFTCSVTPGWLHVDERLLMNCHNLKKQKNKTQFVLRLQNCTVTGTTPWGTPLKISNVSLVCLENADSTKCVKECFNIWGNYGSIL